MWIVIQDRAQIVQSITTTLIGGKMTKKEILEEQVAYLETQHTILTEKNKCLEATVNFYKELLNRTVESYAADIGRDK